MIKASLYSLPVLNQARLYKLQIVALLKKEPIRFNTQVLERAENSCKNALVCYEFRRKKKERKQEQDHKTEATENQKSNGEGSAVAVANQVINNIEGKPHLTHFRAHKNPEVHSDTEVNSFGGNPIHIADELMVDDGGNITLSTRAELANHCLRFAKYQAAVSIPGYKTIKR